MKVSSKNITGFRYPFAEYTQQIVEVLPKEDIIGIENVIFIDIIREFGKEAIEALACSVPHERDKRSDLYISLDNVAKEKIPQYLFNDYPEIASLLLSEIVCHEIGHHVHTFLRHGVGKINKQSFADKYATAGYLKYLLSRKNKILLSYLLASLNVFRFNSEERKMFATSRQELANWLRENEGEEPNFP